MQGLGAEIEGLWALARFPLTLQQQLGQQQRGAGSCTDKKGTNCTGQKKGKKITRGSDLKDGD